MVKISVDIDTITRLVEDRAQDLERALKERQKDPDFYGMTEIYDLIERYRDTTEIFESILDNLTDNEFNEYLEYLTPIFNRVSDMRNALYDLNEIVQKM